MLKITVSGGAGVDEEKESLDGPFRCRVVVRFGVGRNETGTLRLCLVFR